jgi:RNA polymerase sigma-70 factor (ECF subfamily)
VDQAERRRLNEQLARLADGDREAFHPVFHALQPILRRFASRHLGPEDAEDVAQEALVKVFAQASRFDPERDALAWAVEIASWELRTRLRKRKRRREEGLDETVLGQLKAAAPTPEGVAVAKSLDAMVADALSSLTSTDQQTLRAYANDQKPVHVAPATFRKRVERGLRRLRRALGIERPAPPLGTTRASAGGDS